jgi:uncharacterized protein YbgA (DUF1722 family)/uncharacterized protein YbbK (DUF523 family)
MKAPGAPLRIGISSCLLGERVRFDGGHKREPFLVERLGPFVEWVPVCPELEAGLGVPRPALRLVRDDGGVRMVEIASGRDRTELLREWSAARVRRLRALDLSGYVLKKDSPSCGFERVKVYGHPGAPRREGRGLFAEALREALPLLPVEDEGRLNDPRLRENWIERIFAGARLRALFALRWTRGDVVAFHTAHKLQLMAHTPAAYGELGRQVASIAHRARDAFRTAYETHFMQALARLATPGRNANVLQHAAGHLKRRLDAASRRELLELVHDYRRGLVPLVVPVTLLRHHARRCEVATLIGQTFLEPHPRELMLRNHV